MDAESGKLDGLRLEVGLLRREVGGERLEFPPYFSDIEVWRVDFPPFCSVIEPLGVKFPPICSGVEGLRGDFEARKVESPPKKVEIGVVREERDRVKGRHERCSLSFGARRLGGYPGGLRHACGSSARAGPGEGVCGAGQPAAVEHLPDAGGWPGDVGQRGGGGGEARL